MCLNCGCGMWSDDMGNPDNITLEDLAKAAIASATDGKSTLEEMGKAFDRITPEELDQKIVELKNKK